MAQPEIRTPTEELVKQHMAAYDPSHDWFHVDRVRRQALKIARDEKERGAEVDMEVVEIAALFHDIGDFKYQKEGDPSGREIILDFLGKHHFDPRKAELVAKIVENVSFRKELAGIKDVWRDTCTELHM
ncbi:hypothetical protein DFQ26_002347 [Actinomortierella ambigua]|nr:hypothetical protein DFQ26_002347 [Actinomortierella ambigua]